MRKRNAPPRRARRLELARAGRISHLHGEPFTQNSESCLDVSALVSCPGIEHAAHDAFIDAEAPREFGIADALAPHGKIEGQPGSEPPWDRDQTPATFGAMAGESTRAA